ncbi:isochorismatase family protein [Streptomyces sp. NPDC020412]|uniref:isochorismatase family protein n=1 Tax=Streptomyces sp. NPDC020412 TaxID=3365073 RepID=UPI00379D0CEC
MPHGTALLVIDMQQGFLPIAFRGAETVAVIAGLRRRAKAAGAPIVTIQDQGADAEPGTDGWRIVPDLAPDPQDPLDLLVHKTTADGFLRTDLDRILRGLGVTEVVVTGFATEICVETTARQALSHGYDLLLVADGHTTSVRPDSGTYAVPARSIAHHNEIYRGMTFPGRSVRVLPAADVDFAAPAPSAQRPAAVPAGVRRAVLSGSTFEEQIGYARAVVDGDRVHVSGTTGFDYATMTISDDVVAQAEQCLRNITTALTEAGASLTDVVRVRYLLPDRADFEPCWPVLRRHFGEVRPAATMLVCGLADPRMKIEMEVDARRTT